MLHSPTLTPPGSNPTASGLLHRATPSFVAHLTAAVGVSDPIFALDTTGGLSDDTAVTLIVDPGTVAAPNLKQETFTGFVSGTNIVNCQRQQEGAASGHDNGATVICVATATDQNGLIDYLLTEHNPDGTHKTSLTLTTPTLNSPTITTPTISSPKISTAIKDSNNNEIIRTPATGSAVNDVTVTNAATGAAPVISASGDDTNVSIVIQGKGTGKALVQIPFYSTSLSGNSQSETVIGTINVPAFPVAVVANIAGWVAAGLGSGAPTQSWQVGVRITNVSGTIVVGLPDNNKASAGGVSESRVTTLIGTDNIPANTARTYVVTASSSAVIGNSGYFQVMITAQ